MRGLAIVIAAACLAGCVSRDPQLYPDNDAARTLGPLTAHLEGHGTGNGTITLPLPNGEILTGRYSISFGGAVGVGSAYGSGGFASGSAVAIGNSGNGAADMIGPKGTTAHCDLANNNLTGHGNGACQLSSGALYRMQY
jgi:hypothetical protein